MEDSYWSSVTSLIPTNCHCNSNQDTKQNIVQLPQFIPYRTLSDKIIWLDIFVNERNIAFAGHMIESNRLRIFNTAIDCNDFLSSCRHQTSLSSTDDGYSLIISGIYATNVKVIDSLLKHDLINGIYLIIDCCCTKDLPQLYLGNQKIKIVYNDDPDMVMQCLCKDYLEYEIFIKYNSKLQEEVRNDSSNRLTRNNIKLLHSTSNNSYEHIKSENIVKSSIAENDNHPSQTPKLLPIKNQINESEKPQHADNSNATYSSIITKKQRTFRVRCRRHSYLSCHQQEFKLIEPSTSVPARSASDENALKQLRRIRDVRLIFFIL